MITYAKLAEKFLDKSFDIIEFHLKVPFPPIFEPTYWQLQNKSREELFEEFKNSRLKIEELEYLDTWIDRQRHK